MSYDHIRNPQHQSIPASAQGRVLNAMALEGKALTCHVVGVSGALITVQFDLNSIYTLPQITIPLFGPEYIRYPIKEKDLGVCIPVDVSISYTSGQGGSPPDLSTPGNLESLFFMPIGNKNWFTVDPTQVDIYAPNGVKIHDTASGAVINLHPDSVDITVGGTTFNIDGTSITATTETFTINAPTIFLNGQMAQGTGATSYAATLQGPLTVINEVTAVGTALHTHEHSGVESGPDNSGPPV